MINSFLRKFLYSEATASLMLILAAVLAFIMANTALYPFYESFLNTPFNLSFHLLPYSHSLLFWINDGLMVIFFFLMGLEIKREYIQGHLSQPSQRVLPFIATVCGIAVPALIFTLFNYDDKTAIRGWAIPTATDISFALGALMLIKHVPKSLRVFILTVAVLDDLGAIVIIALFYLKSLSIPALIGAGFTLAGLIALNKLKVNRISIYIVLSLLLWIFVLQSGIHATIAGVLAAFTIPLEPHKPDRKNPLLVIEKALHPWVAYGVLPIFAFANSGIPLGNITLSCLTQPLSLGIILGLFLGKQLGIFLGTWVPIKLRWAGMPVNVSWAQLYGMSILCGIGYTMSLFIATLAFEEQGFEYDCQIKLAILIASICSFVYGSLVLKLSTKSR